MYKNYCHRTALETEVGEIIRSIVQLRGCINEVG